MFNKLSNKELITVTNDLAKTLSADTPLLDIAKLLAAAAMRLDVAIVRGNELQKKLGALSHESGMMLGLLNDISHYHEECTHDDMMHAIIPLEYVSAINGFVERDVNGENPCPLTDKFINEVRAEGIHFAVNRMLAAWESGFINDTPEQAYDITGGFLTALEFLPNASPEEFTSDYHGKVRSAIVESRASASSENKLSALPVERDQYGYWTHPVYEQFCDGREHIAAEEFNQWLNQQDLQCSIEYRDEEVIDPAVDGYDISAWQPEAPAGEGWFVASIHDTEDGAVCIWLRPDDLQVVS